MVVVRRHKTKSAFVSGLKDDDDDDDLSRDSDTLLDKTGNEDASSTTLRAAALDQSQNTSLRANIKSPVKLVDGKLEVKIFPTRDEFEANLPETVSILEGPFGSRVYLIGTAHFSEESMNDVSFVMRNVRPDFVMVELCPGRRHIMLMSEENLLNESTDLNIQKLRGIYKQNGLNSIFYILLLKMSSKLTKTLGRAPGCEFRRAFQEAVQLPNCIVHLGDRPIGITITRLLRSLTIWDTVKLIWRLITADDEITAEDVELCKNQSLLEKLMAELAADFPAFDELFVKERDMFMAYSLQNAAMPLADERGNPRAVRVVGVVGIGHAAGIRNCWGKARPEEIDRIMQIPEPQLSKKILKATLKYGFYGLVLFGAYKIIRPRLPANLL